MTISSWIEGIHVLQPSDSISSYVPYKHSAYRAVHDGWHCGIVCNNSLNIYPQDTIL